MSFGRINYGNRGPFYDYGIAGVPLAIPTLIQSQFRTVNPGSGSWVYTFGSTPADGTLMILFSGTAQNKTQSISGGWNILRNSNFLYVYWRIASGEPGGGYTISIAGSFNAQAVGLVFTGFNTDNPVQDYGPVLSTVSINPVTFPATPVSVSKFVYAIACDNHAIRTLLTMSNGFVQIIPSGSRMHIGSRGYTDAATSQDTTFTYDAATTHDAVWAGVNPVMV